MISRPWRERVWFYRPTLHWYGMKSLRPFWFGDDEYHWKTLVVGWNPTGQVVVALHPFPRSECDPEACYGLDDYPGWPVTIHDHQAA